MLSVMYCGYFILLWLFYVSCLWYIYIITVRMHLSTIKKKFFYANCKVTTSYGILEPMSLLGKIEQYDPEQDEWPQYVERL